MWTCITVLDTADIETLSPQIDRVLWVDISYVVLFDIDEKKKALPRLEMRIDIETAIINGKAKILKTDPYNQLRRSESTIEEKHRKKRDEIWDKFICPLVQTVDGQPNPTIFDSKYRGALVAKISAETGRQKWVIYEYLRRYWRYGQMKNALMPNWTKCGGRGKQKSSGNVKRGRPSLITKVEGTVTGINVDEKVREKFLAGHRLFYQTKQRRSWPRAFELTLQKFFNTGYEPKNGVLTPILPPLEQRPTLEQFQYWVKQDLDIKQTLIKRCGQRRYDHDSRPILGNATAMAFGPTSIYQIDASKTIVELVSSLDVSHSIGIAILYTVVDTFSHMIVGVTVTVHKGPKWDGGMLAVENAMTTKEEFCKKYDISLEPGEWPCFYTPEMYLADGGEFEGYNADQLVNGLGIQVATTAPYRPDWKPFVERLFRTITDRGLFELPGARRKNSDARSERNARLDACLTLADFIKIIIHIVLEYNNSHLLKNYPLTTEMIRDGVEPYPLTLWQWGLQNLIGAPRTLPEDVVYRNVLPSDTASVTSSGIRYKGLKFSCAWAVQNDWFTIARTKRSWPVTVSYDPRWVDVLYLHTDRHGAMQRCHLLEGFETFKDLSWEEYDDYLTQKKIKERKAEPEESQARAKTDAQIKAIVKAAEDRQKTALANSPKSKSVWLADKSQYRKAERAIENANFRNENTAISSGPQTVISDDVVSETDTNFTPVGRPKNIDELRQRRNRRLNHSNTNNDTQSEVNND